MQALNVQQINQLNQLSQLASIQLQAQQLQVNNCKTSVGHLLYMGELYFCEIVTAAITINQAMYWILLNTTTWNLGKHHTAIPWANIQCRRCDYTNWLKSKEITGNLSFHFVVHIIQFNEEKPNKLS